MREFKGKVAVITGAASGIGRGLAERFGAEGMKLVLADVEEKALFETAEALKKTGASVLAVPTDVSQAAAVEALAARTVETFGGVHLVCNNAGVGLGGLSWEYELSTWEWIVGVNLWGVIHGLRNFVPLLLRQGEGHIVNTASMAGVVTMPGLAPYCATKHAVIAMSECLHHELSQVSAAGGARVGISVLCPGAVKTRIVDCERNRPRPLRGSRPPTASEQAIDRAIRDSNESGMDPLQVAELTLQAIREERFYVFTHPEIKPAFRQRFDELLEEKGPAACIVLD
ncbi:MAG TPA: SDR family NAD(P)-dependent oxidoreductase [Polyangia bacterium]|nr:SDR family NAD(P)-dependent oxidoreductase [Polyangia bacterium]